MKRQTILGPYELIDGYWCSTVVAEGTIRIIEGSFYYAEDDILYDVPDIVICTKDRRVSKWLPIYSDSLHDNAVKCDSTQ